MYRKTAFALCAILTAALATAQEPAPLTPIPPTAATPNAQTVHYAGPPGVSLLELLLPVVSVSVPKHCNEYDGVVKLSAVVGANGTTRDVKVLSGEIRLSEFAIELFTAQRFKPGSYNGVPAPVAIQATLGLQTCWKPSRGDDNGKDLGLTLRSHPAIAIAALAEPRVAPEKATSTPTGDSQPRVDSGPVTEKVGIHISPPIPISQTEPEYSDYARKERIQGICVLSVIVDANGVPQNVHVVRSLEPSLDDNAVDAVKQYRFKPAMKDGTTPVPVMVTVEVDFHLYKRKPKLF